MKRVFSFLFISFVFLLFPSCGKKGPLLPPLQRTPQKVEILNIFQRGDKIILEWMNPKTYLDGSPLASISEIEIWMVEVSESLGEEPKELTLEEFEKKARLEAVIKKDRFPEYQKKKEETSFEFRYLYHLAGKNSTSRNFIFALRIRDERRRKSELSNLLYIRPQILPLSPRHIESTVFEDRIEIRWESPEADRDGSSPAKVAGYNIYRSEGKEVPHRLNSSLIGEKKYDDRDFLFGKIYTYFVRASSTESSPYLESDDSQALEIEAKDTFPPAAPSGLIAVCGASFITLSWKANEENDLAGYRVWRKEEGQDEYLPLTPQPISENTYNDLTVEKNKRYYYAITALDGLGNESKKSEGVFQILKDEFS